MTSGHILLLCSPAWGHLRPLCAFASKIIQERPDIIITFLTAGDFDKKVRAEIDRYTSDNGAEAKANIRLVNIGGQGDLFQIMPVISTAFPEYYKKLVGCEPVKCQVTGTTFPAVRSPTIAVIELFHFQVLLTIRAITGKTVPILAWYPGASFSSLRLFGPEELGGLADVTAKAKALSEATGRDYEDIVHELTNPSSGELVVIPGMPPTYDYEWFPQDVEGVPPAHDIHAACYHFITNCDGVVSSSTSIYEPEAIEAMRKWLTNTGNRVMYTIGPLVPPGVGQVGVGLSDSAKSLELAGSDNGRDCQAFMDKVFVEQGKNSLIYISFGSIWWPSKVEYLWVFIDVLLELGFPFILSTPSPIANVPTQLTEKVKESGLGFISKWSPQQTILNHPATGWVLSHCGHNTVIETLTQGKPIIAWPINIDQPGNAAHLTLNLDVAFELIQVRTGVRGLKPLYRGVQPTGTVEAVAAEARQVLQSAKGEEGQRKRKNAELIRDNLKEAWEEGGEGLESLRRFLQDASKNA